MYQQELARSGAALFKVRGKYLISVIAIGAVIAFLSGAIGPFATPSANLAWFWVSLGIAVAGALIRVVTSGYAALGTSGNCKSEAVASELNTTGPYSLVRNPLYLGRILNFSGIAMLSGNWVYAALVFLISVLVYERISVYEEEFLRKEFGDAHAKWAQDVPFLLPRLRGWVKPKYPFWWRRCVLRENTKVFAVISVPILNHFARMGFDVGQLTELAGWFYFWVGVAAIELIVVNLRKFTKTFDAIS